MARINFTNTAITATNVMAACAQIGKDVQVQWANIQVVLNFGFDQYELHDDTGTLTRVLNSFVGVSKLPTGEMVKYLEEAACLHVRKNPKAKSQWIVSKSKAMDYVRPQCAWDAHESPDSATKPCDVVKALSAPLKKIQKAMEADGAGFTGAGQLVAKNVVSKLDTLLLAVQVELAQIELAEREEVAAFEAAAKLSNAA